ncbi:hypothetical protein [Salinactinospora qingdaonensis]|uniref:DUF393 domain-containing protein n=1 Tax=Salinactinospora qingdaonensis TaxID=702744 RepID=A0ABP7G2U5_9ACTN
MHRILIYNAGCGLCATIADNLAHQARGWLVVAHRNAPHTRALLERLPRPARREEPLLLLVDASRVRAVRGLALRLRLLIGLGPRRAWTIARHITTAAAGQRDRACPPARLSRRGLLGQATAALTAAAIVTGIGARAARAQPNAPATDDWLAQLDLTGARAIPPGELAHAWQHARATATTQKLLDAELPHPVPELEALRRPTSAVDGHATELGGVIHQIADGGHLTALAWRRGPLHCLSYEARRPHGVRRRATLLRLDPTTGRAHLLASADTDTLTVATGAATRGADCTHSGHCPGACSTCGCSRLDLACAANCCAPCAFACGAVWSCLSCIALWCPLCQSLNNCCTARACQWRESCA